eukprot:GSA25T00011285001.1
MRQGQHNFNPAHRLQAIEARRSAAAARVKREQAQKLWEKVQTVNNMSVEAVVGDGDVRYDGVDGHGAREPHRRLQANKKQKRRDKSVTATGMITIGSVEAAAPSCRFVPPMKIR